MNPRTLAIQTVRADLGLSNTPSDWTYNERVKYNKALADYITAHASEFPPQDLAVAQDIAAQTASPLADNGLLSDLGTFGSAFGDELLSAGEKVGAIGTGVLDSVSAVGKLLPVAVVALFVVYVLTLKKKIEA